MSRQELADAIRVNHGLTENIVITVTNTITGKKRIRRIKNTVTTNGKNMIADRLLASPTLGVPTHMAVGTGSPAANALGTELDRNALTTKGRSGAVLTMVGDWTAGEATGALTEAGVFDASSSGNMHLSASFGTVTISATDALSISWALTVT